MKKLLITLLLVGTTTAAFAQGQVVFKNYATGSFGTINAPIYLTTVGGTKLNSSNTLWRAAIVGGAAWRGCLGRPSPGQPGDVVLLGEYNENLGQLQIGLVPSQC